MHTTIEQSQGSIDSPKQYETMTAYVRMKDSAGFVRHYLNVKSIEWVSNMLILWLDDVTAPVVLREVFTCEIN